MYLLDDENHEFKMDIDKRRNNSPSERLEECRDTMYELHQSYRDLPQVNVWLAGLAPQDLFNTYLYNIECSNLTIELDDKALLSQLETLRLEMLVARTSAHAPKVTPELSVDECKTIASDVKTANARDFSEDQLSLSARQLYQCAMSEYQRDSKMWFLQTAAARSRLLTEVIARQTSKPLGEHAVVDLSRVK